MLRAARGSIVIIVNIYTLPVGPASSWARTAPRAPSTITVAESPGLDAGKPEGGIVTVDSV